MPGSRANINHVVIGPTGVFTVKTKNYSSDVIVRRGEVRHAGRSMDKVVQQAKRVLSSGSKAYSPSRSSTASGSARGAVSSESSPDVQVWRHAGAPSSQG